MKNVFVNDIIKNKDSDDLIVVSVDLELYCNKIVNKIFFSINKIEEFNNIKISDNTEIHSAIFDAIGMIKRLSKNLEGGDSNERL